MPEQKHSEQIAALMERCSNLGVDQRYVLHRLAGALEVLMDQKGPLRKISVIRALESAVEETEKSQPQK
jgi:hypothetical protein